MGSKQLVAGVNTAGMIVTTPCLIDFMFNSHEVSAHTMDHIVDDVTSCFCNVLGLGVADPHFEGTKSVINQP